MDVRPSYPTQLYKMVAERSLRRSLAWDVGTGNGQAALGVAEHYEQVIGTDISEAQLKHAIPHPCVRYLHTLESISDGKLVALIGGEGSVDLITVAQAAHWFYLTRFYSTVNRLLRKQGGLIAVWAYKYVEVDPTFDIVQTRWSETARPYWHPNIQYVFDDYKGLPFPFESVGLGSKGNPVYLHMMKQVSFEGYLGLLRSYSAVATAKEKGVDLLPEGVVKELEAAWGGAKLVRTIMYKAFLLVERVKP